MCAALYFVLEAELFVYLTKIIQGLSVQDYPNGWWPVCVCAAVLCVLKAEPLMYLT